MLTASKENMDAHEFKLYNMLYYRSSSKELLQVFNLLRFLWRLTGRIDLFSSVSQLKEVLSNKINFSVRKEELLIGKWAISSLLSVLPVHNILKRPWMRQVYVRKPSVVTMSRYLHISVSNVYTLIFVQQLEFQRRPFPLQSS